MPSADHQAEEWICDLDPTLSWKREDMHFPEPLTPLTACWQLVEMDAGANYRHAWLDLPIRTHCRVVHGYVYYANVIEAPADEYDRRRQQAREKARAFARLTREYWQHLVLPSLLALYAWMRAVPVESARLEDVALAWDDLWEQVPMIGRMHFKVNIGSYHATNDLATFCESVLPELGPAESLRLIAGHSHELQRVQRDLQGLVDKAAASPSLAQAILAHRGPRLDSLATVDGAFLASLRAFLEYHGHLGPAYDEFALPTWGDEPGLLLREIAKRLDHGSAIPGTTDPETMATAATLTARIRTRLRDQPADLQQFEDRLALAQAVGPLTEDHNYWLDRMLQAHVHRFAIRVGHRLVAGDSLAKATDIFWLTDREVAQTLRHPADCRAIIAERRAAHGRQRNMRPPSEFGAPTTMNPVGNRFYADRPAPQSPHQLAGIGASPGHRRGPARIVVSPKDFDRVRAGDVLVCPSSNPSWVPLFAIIGGLITDTGGATSHAAVIAREFGVPAVVGTGDATSHIRDGQLVELDGATGVVQIAPEP